MEEHPPPPHTHTHTNTHTHTALLLILMCLQTFIKIPHMQRVQRIPFFFFFFFFFLLLLLVLVFSGQKLKIESLAIKDGGLAGHTG